MSCTGLPFIRCPPGLTRAALLGRGGPRRARLFTY